jgi:hypothetical protein
MSTTVVNPLDAVWASPPPAVPIPPAAAADNPLEKIWAQPTPAPQPATPKPAANPLDNIWGQGTTKPTITAPATQSAANPLDSIWQKPSESVPPATIGQAADSNEGIIGKTWDWLNKPLVDLHRQGAGGLESGVEDVASGFTSPLSLGLAAATFGSADALEAVGGPILRALGVSAAKVPLVVNGAKTLMDAGFTGLQVKGLVQTSPRFLDALKDGDYEEAKRLGVNLLAGGALTALSVNAVAHDAGVFADRVGLRQPEAELAVAKQHVGNYLADRTQNGIESKNIENDLRAKLGDADDTIKGAMFRYIEAGGDNDVLQARRDQLASSDAVKEMPAKDRNALLEKYEMAQKLTDTQKDVADDIRASLANDFETAQKNNIVKSAVENYLTHRWESEEPSFYEKYFTGPEDAPAASAKYQADSGRFDTNVSMARKRVFDSSFEGEMLGRKLENDDPIAVAGAYHNSIQNAVAARNLLDALRDKDVRMPDGRPMVALSGGGENLTDGATPATLVDADQMRSIRINQRVVDDMKSNGQLDDLLEQGKIKQYGDRLVPMSREEGHAILSANGGTFPKDIEVSAGKDGGYLVKTPTYGWNVGDYQTIDNPAFRDWNFAVNDSAGNPVLVKGDLRVAPEAADFIQKALGIDRSVIRDNAVGNAALKISSGAKRTLLSLSPFHVVQEGLRAVMTGISPFGVDKIDLSENPVLRDGVVHGLTLGKDYKSMEDFTEGVGGNSGLISKIPVLGNLQNRLQSFLFDRYIPSLKARAYQSLVERYGSANPEWTPAKIAAEAATHTNEVFGGLNYQMMGRSASGQDAFRLAALAPDWLESEVRTLKRAITPGAEGTIMRQDLARISLYTFAVARVLNMLTTGEPHLEAPFGVAVKDKDGSEKIYSLRTLPTDLIHAVSDPWGFLKGRVNPLTFRTAAEAYSGRNDYGQKVTPGQQVTDAIKNVTPISLQGVLGETATGGLTNFDQGMKAAGVPVQKYRTEAEKLASQLASDRSESGLVDPAELEKHQQKMKLEDGLRNGDITPSQVMQAVDAKEAKEILRTMEPINGKSPTMLQTRVKSLPMKDAVQVYQVATKTEQADLLPIIEKKVSAFVKGKSPQELSEDPTFRELEILFPQLNKQQ